jgi:hypothetical protein
MNLLEVKGILTILIVVVVSQVPTYISECTFYLLFLRRVLSCIPGWPGTYYVAQVGLSLMSVEITGILHDTWLKLYTLNMWALQRNGTQVTPEALVHPCLLQRYSQ